MGDAPTVFLSGACPLYYLGVRPDLGVWTERISSNQELMAVALVIFAKWNPIQCLWASILSAQFLT